MPFVTSAPTVDGVTLFNARATINVPGLEGTQLRLGVENITNEVYATALSLVNLDPETGEAIGRSAVGRNFKLTLTTVF